MDSEKSIYPLGTAGRKMISQVPTALKEENAGAVLSRIRKNNEDIGTVNYVYIVEDSRLMGIVPIKKVLFSGNNILMKDIMTSNFVYVSPEITEEKVADLIIKKNIKAMPVLKKGKFLGVVPNDKIMTIINNSLTYDAINFAGIHKSFLSYESALTIPFFKSLIHRLPWLLIGLIGITLAAEFMSMFEGLLEKYLIIAFFVPAVVYMSSAVGSQHQTLLIRDLALMGNQLDIKKYFLKAMLIGLALGIVIFAAVFLLISFLWNEAFMGLIIGISMMITLTFSSMTSLLTTYIISKCKMDSALGSGPFATIISDVSSIIIYFLVVSLLLC
jgi:magnesium transporter